MGVIGAGIAGGLGLLGEKPKVPQWQDVVLGDQQQKAIAANLAALPGAENLVSQANAFNYAQVQQMLEQSIPNYRSMQQNISDNTSSLIRGEIPEDISNMLQLNDAARAIGGGYGGSGMHGNLVARDLGLTSLNLMQLGQDTAARWQQQSAALFQPGMMNISSMFVSPQQQFQSTFQNQQQAWNRNWLRNQIHAMPSPFERAMAEGIMQDEGAITGLIGSVAGYGGGGGGGGGM